MCQPGRASTKVIDSDPHSLLAKEIELTADPRGIIEQRRLGEFDCYAASSDAALIHESTQMSSLSRMFQLAGRDIDAHGEMLSSLDVAMPILQLVACPAEDPATEVGDQARPLCERYEHCR